VALLLKRQGITRIRPLQGGLDAWRNLGYPMENVETVLPATVPAPSSD
jgi:3-mercaptopyruvate sulfurtransferase SseA